ncbi:uncharacterized protein M6B38_346025 [Iris pallida]|uniref:Peptidase A1 domain-containing protein n=1 Tax=Iris pallida TaxID=29817 RepID=A0AAX6GUF6_IRIPA|nr:uncharacterized protein M6B38_346025 [Iris pallida]
MDSPRIHSFFFFFFFFCLVRSYASADLCANPPHSSSGARDLSIFHANSKCSTFSPPTSLPIDQFQTVLSSAAKDPSRLIYLSSLVAGTKPTTVPVASGQQFMQTNNYVLRAKLGTPGQLLFLALDTGSDAAWVPCAGCSSCPAASASFSPPSSSTYKTVDCASGWCPQFKGPACAAAAQAGSCGYNVSYGGNSFFSATLSQDTLRLAHDMVPDYVFGCVNSVTGGNSMPKQGLLGLGRGSSSLMAQSLSLYQGVFSYCLPSFKSYYFSGSLRLGSVGQPKIIRTTPLLLNPHRPSLYYVNLTAVSIGRGIGRVTVPVPPGSFDFDPQTGAGTVVDSGTVITRFVGPAYMAIRDEFRRQVSSSGNYSSLGAFDTCFATTGDLPVTPAVTLHLTGLDLTLPVENTLIHSSSTPLACLAMAAAPDNVNAVVNVIANYQQQNYRVLLDAANSKVGFARELCN